MHILNIYLDYTRHILCISHLNFLHMQFIFFWYIWYIHRICHAYTEHLLGIYLAYTMYIPFKFSGYTVQKFFDIHSIFIEFSMHISIIYITYDIKTLPCPCTCHEPFHLDSAVALALLFPTQRESLVCLWKETHGQSHAVVPWDTSSLRTVSWDT